MIEGKGKIDEEAPGGAEAEFGANAERYGIEEANFTFDVLTIVRNRGLRVLNHEELKNGDVSLEYISKLMNRRYTDNTTFRKILQTIWCRINHGQEILIRNANIIDGTGRPARRGDLAVDHGVQ